MGHRTTVAFPFLEHRHTFKLTLSTSCSEYEKSYAFHILVILKKGNAVARFMEKPQISTVIFSKQFAAEDLMNPPKIDIMEIGKSFFLKMI